jgi:putative transposase
MTFPLVRDRAAEGFPVRLTCGVLGSTAQAFYKWPARQSAIATGPTRTPSRRSSTYTLMILIPSSVLGSVRKAHGKTPGPAVHDDLMRRVFSAPAPDLLWLTDITEHSTVEGELYCCSIKDVFSNRIVGYAFGPRMTAQLAVRALRSAIARRQPEGTVVGHSARSGQFRSRTLRAVLINSGARRVDAGTRPRRSHLAPSAPQGHLPRCSVDHRSCRYSCGGAPPGRRGFR